MALPIYRIAKTAHGGPPEREEYTAGGTITAGAMVAIAADDGKVNVIGDDAGVVLGIALGAAVDTEKVIVLLPTAHCTLSGAIKSGTFAITDINNAVNMDAAGLDCDTTDADSIAVLLGEDTTDPSGYNPGTPTRVLFRIRDTAIQTTGSAFTS